MVRGASMRLLLGCVTAAIISACALPNGSEVEESTSAQTTCGRENQACCAEGATRCTGDLGCSGNVCRSINSDMVAYTEYCKEQLGFRDPREKMAFVSCYDAEAADGSRIQTGKQALLTLTRNGQTLNLSENGPAVSGSSDVWDLMYGSANEGCDNPNYLGGSCDPYYRLNVFQPDPGNPDISAALHCRSTGGKPSPSTAITAEARRRAYESSTGTTSEKNRLFEQWNATSEIVLTMTNLKTGKACFFHAKSPYFGSHVPAPDNETDLSAPGATDKVWSELPVKPAYSKTDTSHHSEWLRNGKSAWQRPDYMRCTGCHDSGPFMHDPFIDSMGVDYLPRDRATRPYIPLGWQGAKTFLKTGPVKNTSTGEMEPQKCTTCHSMGPERECDSWFDRAVGWTMPYSQSNESQQSEAMKRYMPFAHGMKTKEDFYAEYGPSIDAMKCCCEHPSWRGCKTVPAATPQASGTEGTGSQSCTEPTCGGHNQACCNGGGCNHSGLRCSSSNTCLFRDE